MNSLVLFMFLVLLMIVATGWLASEFVHRGKQIRSYITLNSISMILEKQKEKGDQLEIEAVVNSVNDGRDAWGNEIAYAELESKIYLLVSAGSDGAFEYDILERYCELKPRNIRGEFYEDIVFLAGSPLTFAGK